MNEPFGYYLKGNRAIFGPGFFAKEGPALEKQLKERELIPFYSEPQYPGQEPFAYVYGICLFFVKEVEEFEDIKPLEGWDALAYLGAKK